MDNKNMNLACIILGVEIQADQHTNPTKPVNNFVQRKTYTGTTSIQVPPYSTTPNLISLFSLQ
jgi:hypothetical protein